MKSVCSSAGSLPSVEDGVVDREACTDVNCHPVYDIQIINCPDISYVYYLVPTISCDDAYCMGTLHVIIALNFSNKIAKNIGSVDGRTSARVVVFKGMWEIVQKTQTFVGRTPKR